MRSVLKILFIVLLVVEIFSISSKRDWDYTFLSFNSNSTDPSLADAGGSFKVVRRGVYGASGFYYVDESVMDKDLKVTLEVFYNPHHNENFEMTPMHVGPGEPLLYVNGLYKNHFMRSIKNCSNAPQFEEKLTTYEGLAGNYTFDKCIIQPNHLPTFVRPGYYLIRTTLDRKVPPLVKAVNEIRLKVEKIVVRN